MPTPVLMPQMGESIAEGTIVRWMKKVGDHVDRDEPLFEISTDKVDAEIPSPAAGVLVEIRVKEGETVPVESVVAAIGLPEEALEDGAAQSPVREPAAVPAGGPTPVARGSGAPALAPTPAPPASAAAAPAGAAPSADDTKRRKSSPLVRRIAREHHIDVTQLTGSGLGGRVTKHDILGFIEAGADTPPAAAPASARASSVAPGDRVEPLSVMRRKIAEHMVISRRTSAHVHTVFHVNFSRVESIRQQKRHAYQQAGVRLTYLTFIAKACVDALRRYPIVNAAIDGDNVVFKKEINIGIAVALEAGLIVPVVRHADEKNMLGLSRAIVDVSDRARAKQLRPEDVHGGTFTITNPGQFGAQFGLPIISQPQVAILGVGTIEKRPVVVEDAIAIRTMAYLALGFDHRLIDGAVADQFMADIKHQLENFDAEQV
jgi:pyruvate dehydrogenase E2 component (dihydrolipoamide acetyltransferase)